MKQTSISAIAVADKFAGSLLIIERCPKSSPALTSLTTWSLPLALNFESFPMPSLIQKTPLITSPSSIIASPFLII
ncbi:hypothetical protein D3C85_971410 [compost metagenome]